MFAERVATAMIPARDVGRAVAWYRNVLGLEPARFDENGATYALNGVRAFLYRSEYAGTAEHTILSFDTPDLLADMREMRGKGVAFLDYDLPGFRTRDGVAEFGTIKNAWCRDSEGNILGFVEGM